MKAAATEFKKRVFALTPLANNTLKKYYLKISAIFRLEIKLKIYRQMPCNVFKEITVQLISLFFKTYQLCLIDLSLVELFFSLH